MNRPHRYEDRYGNYLRFFQQIAEEPRSTKIIVANAPYCWAPLLRWLDCDIVDPLATFSECGAHLQTLRRVIATMPRSRHELEVLCSLRPETIDALWKCDMEWKTDRMHPSNDIQFPITNTAGFFRPEIMRFMVAMDEHYAPTKRKVVIVPCAADKPYPSPLHQAVIDRLPNRDEWYIAVATGALGIVPEDMWPTMPDYDAGIPNQWRIVVRAISYFSKFEHDAIVVYSDFNNEALAVAAACLQRVWMFVNPASEMYLDLLDEDRLLKLSGFLRAVEYGLVGNGNANV